MKMALTVLYLILCGAMATSFYEVTDGEDSQLNNTIYQEESPLDDGLYKEDEQESNTAAVQYNPRVVVQGSTIALQCIFDKRTWMSCSSSDCRKNGCPKLYMDPHDWTNCWGEVFQIYRLGAQGNIIVGDMIGLHYQRVRGQWFSLNEGNSHKSNCPGPPNLSTGFSHYDRWFDCYGDIFKIFAQGIDGRVKNSGENIVEHDVVLLYAMKERKFISFSDVPHLQTCPGNFFVPPANKYDGCWGEVAELWLR